MSALASVLEALVVMSPLKNNVYTNPEQRCGTVSLFFSAKKKDSVINIIRISKKMEILIFFRRGLSADRYNKTIFKVKIADASLTKIITQLH